MLLPKAPQKRPSQHRRFLGKRSHRPATRMHDLRSCGVARTDGDDAVNQMVACIGSNPMHEESPGSIGQGCKLTACGGDSKDSATERYRLSLAGKGGKAR